MTRPQKHPKTGVYWFRKAIPPELRPVIGMREWKKTLGTKDANEARRLHLKEAARCEAAFQDARAGLKLTDEELTQRDIEAVTAEWLRRELEVHEADVRPQDEENWIAAADDLVSSGTGGDVDDPEPTIVPKQVLRIMREDIKQLLKREGLRISEDSPAYSDLALKLFERKHAFATAMSLRASGDWRPLHALELAPKWKGSADRSKTLQWAFEAWTKARKPKPKTVYEFERYVKEFGAERRVQEIAADDIRTHRDSLVSRALSANYIDKKLQALRSIFKWLVREGHLVANPTTGVGVASLKKERERKKRDGYSRDDALALLKAARKEGGGKRWLPWLLAATGARLNEICQSLVSDVIKEEGIWYLNITDVGEGQGIKAEASRRRVPIHPDLIAEGFLEYVASLPKGGRLIPEASENKVGNWGAKMGQWYGRWARELVSDKRKVAHSWRHSFKTWAREASIGEENSDALTGHKQPGRVGRDYGTVPLKTLAQAIAKIDFGAPPPLRATRGKKTKD